MTDVAQPPGRCCRERGQAGAAAFWLTNLAVSLTPLAAQYRAALSMAYAPMLVEAALGGLLTAACVSWVLLRLPARLAAKHPMVEAALISFGIRVILTALIEIPAKFLTSSATDPWRYFVIGTAIDALRFLALGLAVGYASRHTSKHAGGWAR